MTENNGTFNDVWDLDNTSITNLKKDKKNDNELKDKKKDLFDDVLDYYEPSNKKKENTKKSIDKNNTTITPIKPIAKPKSKKKKKILPKLVIDDY